MTESHSLNDTFSALSDPTRRAIVEQLCSGEQALGKLALPFNISQTAVTKHVKVLADAGLVVVEKRGRTRHCRLDAAPMGTVYKWLQDYQKFWEFQLDNLANHLDANTKEKSK